MKLIEQILDKIPKDVFTDTELVALFPGKDASRYNQVKRSINRGEKVKQAHPEKEVQVFFQDETRYEQKGGITQVWAKKGNTPRSSQVC